MEIKLNMWDNNVSHCSNIKEAGLRCGVRNNKIPIDYSQKFTWEIKKEIFSFTHSKGVTVFTDKYFHPKIINSVSSDIKIGLIFEPKGYDPHAYSSAENVEHLLDFIFTFDEYLLEKNPLKYKFYPADWVCIEKESNKIHPKNKIASMIYSHKGGMDRTLRGEVANVFGYKLSLYGSGSPNGPLDIKSQSLNDYMFSVVMENSIADNYYTEKIIDCFITGNIPIYRGCKNIGKFFDKRGIIEFNNIEDLRHILDSLTPQKYEEMLPYVKINFELALKYQNPDNILYDLINKCLNNVEYKTIKEFTYGK